MSSNDFNDILHILNNNKECAVQTTYNNKT